MRFEVSRVMDTIEQHLTTDPLLAQAVFDLEEIARYPELDGGRGINVIRIGMVVDALGRYLRDGGVFLYPVAPRKLLSDPELTAKERMVLGRWTDGGLIETTADAAQRVPEVADLTGLPIITVRTHAELAKQFAFLVDAPLRVLTVTPRGGGALLTDGSGGTGGVLLRRRDEEDDEQDKAQSRQPFRRRLAVGKGTPVGKGNPVAKGNPAGKIPPLGPDGAESAESAEPVDAVNAVDATEAAEAVEASEAADGPEPADAAQPAAGAGEGPADGAVSTRVEARTEAGAETEPSAESAADSDDGVDVYAVVTGTDDDARAGVEAATTADHTASEKAPVRPPDISIWPDPSRVYVTLLSEPPAIRTAPSGVGGALLARLWHCGGFDCPGFGDGRRVGQPVPHMRKGVPVCPRHDERLKDAGPRPGELAVALLVDGLRRHRFVVHEGRPVVVGREPDDDDGIAVGVWLHDAAANWISPEHLALAVDGTSLVVTDLSPNGSLVWIRPDPQARPETRRLRRGESYVLGEWDTVELYTGIELGHGERRPSGVDASADEPASVLIDAPTVAMLRLDRR